MLRLISYQDGEITKFPSIIFRVRRRQNLIKIQQLAGEIGEIGKLRDVRKRARK